LSGGAGANGLKVEGSLGTTNDFKGNGSTQRKESIRSKLSARVIEVDAQSGNLVIEGKRTTKINGETQTIVIKGIVRPVDVMSNNSVFSYSILDLTLLIEGDGTVSKVQEPGLITKFLRMLF
jgi:flagellar L-ring protein precursor FlgH